MTLVDAPDLSPPESNEVIIEVWAAGVNRLDLLQRQGRYPPPSGASEILGVEVSGIVTAAGSQASWRIGDKVVALLDGGGYASEAKAHSDCVLPLPRGFSFIQGAAVMEATLTSWSNLHDMACLQSGQRVLIHGGSSGVGCVLIQLAKHLGAGWIATTVGSQRKQAAVLMLGADLAVNYQTEGFADVIGRATEQIDDENRGGVDVIVDIVGTPYVQENLNLLRQDGCLVQLSMLGGKTWREGALDLSVIMRNRLRWMGATLRARPLGQKRKLVQQVFEKVWPLLEAGSLKIPIHATFPLEHVLDAHQLMKESGHIGKIVLAVRSDLPS